MTPFFSVIIPLYNKEAYIHATITSVLNQTLGNFEICIINDGSTDNSLNIVKAFSEPRIVIIDQKNSGLSSARNKGIEISKCNYIAFLDADDLWCTNYLQTISDLIAAYDDCKVYATKSKSWFKKHDPNLLCNDVQANYFQLICNYFKIRENTFSYSSIVFHKSVFENIGCFNENVNYGEEEDFTIRCFLKYRLAYCNQSLVFYLVGIDNQLTLPNKKFKRVIPNYDVHLKNTSITHLRRYIDFIHYKLVVLYKMEKNHQLVSFYKKKISLKNLSLTQQIKLNLPTNLFYISKSVYVWFSKRFIHS